MMASPVAIQRLLLDVEGVPASEVGALVVGRGLHREGAILVEVGRVCWAAAERMPRRLSDLLLGRARGLGASDLQRTFQRCRDRGLPFGECLVNEGHMTAEDLRAALLDHTVDALGMLASLERVTQTWVSREARSYDPRFTFSTVELATVAATRGDLGTLLVGRTALSEVLPSGAAGVTLFRGRGVSRPVLVAHHRAEAVGIRGVAGLTTWATGSLDLATAFADPVSFVVAIDEVGGTWVGWREEELIHVALCERGEDLALLLGRLRRR